MYLGPYVAQGGRMSLGSTLVCWLVCPQDARKRKEHSRVGLFKEFLTEESGQVMLCDIQTTGNKEIRLVFKTQILNNKVLHKQYF